MGIVGLAKWLIASVSAFTGLGLISLAYYFSTHPPLFTADDATLLRHLNLSTDSTTFSTLCGDFLLPESGALYVENVSSSNWGKGRPNIQGWSGGEWVYPSEALKYGRERKFLRVTSPDNAREAAFAVKEANHDWLHSFNSTLHPAFTPVKGCLILEKFWDWTYEYYQAEVASEIRVLDNMWMLQSLKILLDGAFVTTDIDRRICMTGCAYRFDHSHQIDCGFVLKMKYPNHHTIKTPRIEAEVSSARSGKDPLSFPAFPIIGPSVTTKEYNFMAEDLMQSALNMGISHVSSSAAAFVGRSMAGPGDLVKYLEGSHPRHLRAVISPISSQEQSVFKRQRKVVVDPFSTPYYPSQETRHSSRVAETVPETFRAEVIPNLSPDLAEIELFLTFKNILAKPSNLPGGILVSGMMEVECGLSQYRLHDQFPAKQRPLSVEGIWNSTSGALCMIGCRVVEFSSTLDPQNGNLPGDGCDWKICIQSVLSRFMTIDSPGDSAVVSSLHEDAGHPDYFRPLGFQRWRSFPWAISDSLYPEVKMKLVSLSEYRYTVVAKARELAERDIDADALKLIAKNNLTYKEPYPDMQLRMQGSTASKSYVVDVFINYIDSCNAYLKAAYGGDLNWRPEGSRIPLPGTYLKVAVEFSIWKSGKEHDSPGHLFDYRDPFVQMQRAEGVYEPYTGKMHLVAHLKPRMLGKVRNAAVLLPFFPLQRTGGVAEIEDHEIYIKIQRPLSYESYEQHYINQSLIDGSIPVDPFESYLKESGGTTFTLGSLRPKWDLLYFPSVTAN